MEFALVLPILLMLIVSAIEFGRLFYTKIVITNAAREGAYYMATHHENVGVVTDATSAAVTEASNSGIPNITVGITPSSGWLPGDSVTVTVNTTVENVLIISYLGNLFSISKSSNSFNLSSSVEMMAQP